MTLCGANWKLLNFDDAMVELDKVEALYDNQEIGFMTFDTETSHSLQPWGGGEIIMYSWAHDKSEVGYAVPLVVNNTIAHTNLTYSVPVLDFEINHQQKLKLKQRMSQLLKKIPIVGHNLKYDGRWLCWHDYLQPKELKIHADTMVMAFQLFNREYKGSLTLKTLCNKYCEVQDNWEWDIQDYLKRYRLLAERHYGNIPTGLLGSYAAKDGLYNLKLYHELNRRIPKYMRSITKSITDSIPMFIDIELKGVHVDQDMRGFLATMYSRTIEELEQKIRSLPIVQSYTQPKLEVVQKSNNSPRKKNKLTDKEMLHAAFNINSNTQLIELIYGHNFYGMSMDRKFMTKGKKPQPQVSKDYMEYLLSGVLSDKSLRALKDYFNQKMRELELEPLRQQEMSEFNRSYPRLLECKKFITYLLDYNRIQKLNSTYIDSLEENCFAGTQKPEFNLVFVKTGRLSSGFHTIPNGCDIKRLYNSRFESEGGLFVAFDQSQLELRIAASLANEHKLIEAYKEGIDVHKKTAASVYGVELEQVTSSQRKEGKITNFAVLYGKVAKNLADDLDKSEAECQRLLDGFFNTYSNITSWMKEQNKFARKNGYIITPMGRRLPIPESMSDDRWEVLRGDRLSVNYPTQSSGSDVVVLSTYNAWVRMQNLKSVLVGTVHDSMELDVYPGELFEVTKIMKEECEVNIREANPWLLCPLQLSMEIGKSWGGAMEAHILEADSNHLLLELSGMSKDIRQLKMIAERAYDVDLELLHEREATPKDFNHDVFVRDSLFWGGKLLLSRKTNLH